jgi:hypothetical protein
MRVCVCICMYMSMSTHANHAHTLSWKDTALTQHQSLVLCQSNYTQTKKQNKTNKTKQTDSWGGARERAESSVDRRPTALRTDHVRTRRGSQGCWSCKRSREEASPCPRKAESSHGVWIHASVRRRQDKLVACCQTKGCHTGVCSCVCVCVCVCVPYANFAWLVCVCVCVCVHVVIKTSLWRIARRKATIICVSLCIRDLFTYDWPEFMVSQYKFVLEIDWCAGTCWMAGLKLCIS